MNLAHRSFSAARWTTASAVMRGVLQLAQVAVLARLLAPSDYGLMSMVMVVQSYAELFSDMGLSTAFIHRQKISDDERSSLYWLSIALGTALMLAVMSISPLAAYFFKEPRLVPLMMLTATNLVVTAIGQQLRMEAAKSLEYRPVAIIEIAAYTCAFLTALLAAWLGWGVYALVAGAMVNAWLTMVLTWILLSNGWRPNWRFRWDEVRWFARFGGGMVLNNLAGQINLTIDVLIGGRLLGAAQLGLYSLPRTLILQAQTMVNPIITRIGFPLIASIQHDPEGVRRVYLKSLNMTASVNAPIYVALGTFAPEFVGLLWGDRWVGAAPLLRLLAVWGLLRSFSNPVGSLLFGLGRVRLATWWNLALLAITPPAVWLGSRYGVTGMAWAMAGLVTVLYVPEWAILVRSTCKADLLAYSLQLLRPVSCALLAAALARVATTWIGAPVVRLMTGAPIGLCAYLLASRAINREWLDAMARFFRTGLANRSA